MNITRWLPFVTMLIAALVAILGRRAEPPAVQTQMKIAPGLTYGQIREIVLTVVFLVLGIICAIWIASRISEVLTILAVAILLSTALRPTMERISRVRVPGLRRTVPRPIAILLLYVGLILAVAGVLLLVVPQLVREARNLALSAPEYAAKASAMLSSLHSTYPWIPEFEDLQAQFSDQLAGQLAGSADQVVSLVLFAVNVVSSLFSVGLALVLTFLLLMEGDRLFDHIIYLLPESQEKAARALGAEAGKKVESWLRGVLILSIFIGVFTTIGMWLIGMPYPLLLGLVAGLFELIPMVGATLGAIPAVTIALFQSPLQLLLVIGFVFLLQQLENNLLVPAIMGSQLEISPLLTIIALLIGAALMGVVGALLAVPVAAILQVVWLDVVVPWVKGGQGRAP